MALWVCWWTWWTAPGDQWSLRMGNTKKPNRCCFDILVFPNWILALLHQEHYKTVRAYTSMGSQRIKTIWWNEYEGDLLQTMQWILNNNERIKMNYRNLWMAAEGVFSIIIAFRHINATYKCIDRLHEIYTSHWSWPWPTRSVPHDSSQRFRSRSWPDWCWSSQDVQWQEPDAGNNWIPLLAFLVRLHQSVLQNLVDLDKASRRRIASSLDLVSITSNMLQNSAAQRLVVQAVQVYDRIVDFDGATGCAEIQQKMKLGKIMQNLQQVLVTQQLMSWCCMILLFSTTPPFGNSDARLVLQSFLLRFHGKVNMTAHCSILLDRASDLDFWSCSFPFPPSLSLCHIFIG